MSEALKEAIKKAAKQIHDEFDCLSDHVMTKKAIREQIACIIWKHIGTRKVEAALSRSAGPTDEPGFDEATETRWQKAIYEVCKEAVGPEHYSEIDGAGCDSGDSLDFTITEIQQALEFVRENSRSAPDREVACKNPHHHLTDGSVSPHEIGPSCMAESPSESAPNPCHDVPRKSAENVPATNSRCDAGGTSTAGENPTDGGHLESAPAPEGGDERVRFEGWARTYLNIERAGKGYTFRRTQAAWEAWEERAKLPAPEGMGRDVDELLKEYTRIVYGDSVSPEMTEKLLEFGKAYAFMLAHPTSESGTDGKLPIEIVDLLTNVAQLLDVIKGEWGDEWSAWDQEQRDAITKHLTNHYSGRSGDKQVLCAARHSDTGPNDPQDCDWPFCGCDPKADKVIEAIEESGFKIVKAESGRVEEQANIKSGVFQALLGLVGVVRTGAQPFETLRNAEFVIKEVLAGRMNLNTVSPESNEASHSQPSVNSKEK